MNSSEPVIRTVNLKKYFPVRGRIFDVIRRRPKLYVRAVDDITFDIYEREIFGLAGESGCGKTTTGKTILRLIEPTSGKLFFKGDDLLKYDGSKLKEFRRRAQIIFQDPYESLNPRMNIYSIVEEPLRIHKIGDKNERLEMVFKVLEDVELKPPEDFIYRRPHELSGGQRQRVAIARAMILNPEFIVADEPVSMLDMSIRAEILNLMLKLRDEYKLTYLFITHDLAVAKYICSRLGIMYLGKLLELGSAEKVIDEPYHPYTRALISAIPTPDPREKIGEIPIKGEVTSPINVPKGCRFYPRCVRAMDICKEKEPKLIEVSKGHFVACHLYA
ncbi:MAG: ABC transporter ATP-binding protein [Candidatus Verstraetearchaeota archaeon]|nr:ABC transporter ATP-binding protein [Candidatus Verstraetearchaeota archaeon]